MPESRLRFIAGLVSLLMGILIMMLKFQAFHLTQSKAILSDAFESIVNVVAAAFALWAIRASEDPPDQNHPYGHGKIEFVTAVFEGGLISFAALMIAYEAINSLVNGPTLPNLDAGLATILTAGALNGLLGFFLLYTGKKTSSMALTADGKHVLSDFLTSIGIILGLGLVKLTNLAWLDPAMALVMALVLAYTGVPLVRDAINGLIDAADHNLLEKILTAFERHRSPALIRAHHVRAMRNGRRIHVDGHLVLPEFWSVEDAHDYVEKWQQIMTKDIFLEGEMEFHIDPCRRVYCKICEVEPCPIREAAFTKRPPLSFKEMVSTVDITDRHK